MDENELLTRLREEGTVLVSLPGSKTQPRWGLFRNPVKRVVAYEVSEVEPAFRALEAWLKHGNFAAGFISYEAAPAFDSCLETHSAGNFPLLALGFYDQAPEPVELPYRNDAALSSPFVPELTEAEYRQRIAAIHSELFAGNIYQANLTFRCRAPLSVEPEALFLNLASRHPVPFAAWIKLSGVTALSLSPELFLESDGTHIVSSPMKGTSRRLPVAEWDRQAANALAHDPKNLAENLMITDMVRNDLGRVCEPGGISVDPLFHVDTYGTVHQMISTVHGVLPPDLRLFELFQAVFPPASITGAPKVRAMHVIRENEKSPRRIYTGTIGCFFPGNVFRLNVAIRTLTVCDGSFETGIGGGITYDSEPGDEWREALLKSRYATQTVPEFEVFETMRWTKTEGFVFLAEHIRRAESSQAYFGRPLRPGAIKTALDRLLPELEDYSNGACVKFTLDRSGGIRVEVTPPRLPDWNGLPLQVLISKDRTAASDVFLYHETTHREFYNTRFHAAREQGFHEVLFFNTNGNLTEGAISSVFLRKDGKWLTPALECGLLPGIQRARRICDWSAEEACLTLDDLLGADEVIVCNSLRGEGRVEKLNREPGGNA